MGTAFQKPMEGVADAQIAPDPHKDRTSGQTLMDVATTPRCAAFGKSCAGSALFLSLYADARLSFCGVNRLASLTACCIFSFCIEKGRVQTRERFSYPADFVEVICRADRSE